MSETFRKKNQARQSADWLLGSDGKPLGLIGPDEKLYRVVAADTEEGVGDGVASPLGAPSASKIAGFAKSEAA